MTNNHSNTYNNEEALSRIVNLEDINEIERCKLRLSRAIDEIVNEGRAVRDVRCYTCDDYSWGCTQFNTTIGIDAYERFLEVYRKRITFALSYVTGGIIDVNLERAEAKGRWSVWQPFSMDNVAWILIGRSHDTFTRRGGEWKVQTTNLDVAVLSPWVDDWGTTQMAKSWNWECAVTTAR